MRSAPSSRSTPLYLQMVSLVELLSEQLVTHYIELLQFVFFTQMEYNMCFQLKTVYAFELIICTYFFGVALLEKPALVEALIKNM